MRATNAAEAGRDTARTTDKDKLPFRLGELVICRYSAYPYWPATIDQTHQSKLKGNFWDYRRTRRGNRVLSFWCTFSNEDTGGWVRGDRMVRYHPDIVDRIRLDSAHDHYDEQHNALIAAQKAFASLPHTDEAPKDLPSDYGSLSAGEDLDTLVSDSGAEGTDDDDDDGSSSESERGSSDEAENRRQVRAAKHPAKRQRPSSAMSTTPKKPGPKPKAKRESKREPKRAPKRTSTPAAVARPRKRVKTTPAAERARERDRDRDLDIPKPSTEDRAAYSQSDETGKAALVVTAAEMGARNEQISRLQIDLKAAQCMVESLRKKLDMKERELKGLTESTIARFQSPPSPDSIKVDVPPKDVFLSKPVGREKFAAIMLTLKETFENFKSNIRMVDEERFFLDEEKTRLRKEYEATYEKVYALERAAVQGEKDLANQLRDILQLKAEVPDLREHKAGNVVRAIGRACKQLPSINVVCNEIYSAWKAQVLHYLDHNSGVADSGNQPASLNSSPENQSPQNDPPPPPREISGRPALDNMEIQKRGKDDAVIKSRAEKSPVTKLGGKSFGADGKETSEEPKSEERNCDGKMPGEAKVEESKAKDRPSTVDSSSAKGKNDAMDLDVKPDKSKDKKFAQDKDRPKVPVQGKETDAVKEGSVKIVRKEGASELEKGVVNIAMKDGEVKKDDEMKSRGKPGKEEGSVIKETNVQVGSRSVDVKDSGGD